MELLIKIFGYILILCASTLTGFLKSYAIRFRFTKLNEIYRSISDLKERIRLNGGEIDRLINESFDKRLITKDKDGFRINGSGLIPQDISLINEYLLNIGMSDIQSECDRTELYMSLILKQCEMAEKDCHDLCRLYSTLGFLFGVFLCIFLL